MQRDSVHRQQNNLRSLRFPEENDEQFRCRVERTAVYARLLVDACLKNYDVQAMIADPDDPHTIESLKNNPIVRVEYEEAIVLGGIGESLAAAKSKSWGAGPQILPLEPEDPVGGLRIGYIFKETSRYNRRFKQRQRMKEMLGKRFRPLVERAKYHRHTKKMFLEGITADEVVHIRRIFDIDPGTFWRACRGKIFLELPSRLEQLTLPFLDIQP